MAGRYTSYKPLTRCFSPITVFHNGRQYVVPCGKCAACLLDKSNEWSMRVSNEIENTNFPIFFTLTYDNHYLPKASVFYDPDSGTYQVFSYPTNVRFNGKVDVKRVAFEPFYLSYDASRSFPVQHFPDGVFGYLCKDDFILWLKLLKKDLYEQFGEYRLFRHYLISEYGPTTYRPHAHGILFCQDKEVAEYLIRISMYKNWAMCDKTLFEKYTHYCDSGASQYVTNYITCPSSLPSLFKSTEFKPFRLASKSPGIGYCQFDPAEIYESIYRRTIEYTKTVARIGQRSVLDYPSMYCSRLFPKCYEFSLLSFDRLLDVYGELYWSVRAGKSFEDVCFRLRQRPHVVDYECKKRCYDYCVNYECNPYLYVYLVYTYWYLRDMSLLRRFYEWQEKSNNPISIAFSYSNFADYICSYDTLDGVQKQTIDFFCNSLGFDAFELFLKGKSSLVYKDVEKELFQLEVEDIIDNSVKMPKFYEKTGLAPHIV